MAGCGSSADKKADSAPKKPDKIVAGIDDTFAPMGFRDENGEIVGFDIDMGKAVSKEIGVPIEFKPIDWASKESEIASGRINAIWNGLTVTEERKKVLDYTEPYLNNKQVFVVLNSSDITDAKQLAGRKVCAQEGSTSQTAMDKQPEVRDLRAVEAVSGLHLLLHGSGIGPCGCRSRRQRADQLLHAEETGTVPCTAGRRSQ